MLFVRKFICLLGLVFLLSSSVLVLKADETPSPEDYLPEYQEETSIFSIGAKESLYQLSEEEADNVYMMFMAKDIETLKQKVEILNDDVYEQRQTIVQLKIWNTVLSAILGLFICVYIASKRKD